MRRAVAGDEARRVFETLAEEEKRHLDLLTARLERTPGRGPRAPGPGAVA